MNDFPITHPYRYTVWFTFNGGPEQSKTMAFGSAQDLAAIQARDTDIVVTRVESAGGQS